MRILITAAEEEELITARQAFNSLSKSEQYGLDITYMLTGIGTTSTSYKLTKILNSSAAIFDLAVNIGIAGSFSSDFPIGSVARVKKEFFGDLGFQTYGGFQTLFDYKILDADTHPFKESMEGAAFFYVSILEKIPFIELRSVSNEVGERNRAKWDIPLALDSLKTAVKVLMEALSK